MRGREGSGTLISDAAWPSASPLDTALRLFCARDSLRPLTQTASPGERDLNVQAVFRYCDDAMSLKIAVIFDFDDTLAPDSTSAFLASMGIDVDDFWGRRVKRLLGAHWDPIPAYLYEMIVESNARPAPDRITRDRLAAFADRVELFPGVKEIFPALRAEAQAIDRNLSSAAGSVRFCAGRRSPMSSPTSGRATSITAMRARSFTPVTWSASPRRRGSSSRSPRGW
jgi:hypothetical protein